MGSHTTEIITLGFLGDVLALEGEASIHTLLRKYPFYLGLLSQVYVKRVVGLVNCLSVAHGEYGNLNTSSSRIITFIKIGSDE